MRAPKAEQAVKGTGEDVWLDVGMAGLVGVTEGVAYWVRVNEIVLVCEGVYRMHFCWHCWELAEM